MAQDGSSGTTTRAPLAFCDLRDIPGSVDRVLAEFLADATAALTELDPALDVLTTVARDAVLGGGKRVRPLFAYWGWRGVAGPHPPAEPVLPALAALEVLHAFAIVHDDVMDRSDTRRGRPTAHRALAASHTADRLRGSPERFGQSTAILVGDLCLVWADQLIARSGLPADVLQQARRGYDRMRSEAVAGQFLDLLGEVSAGWSVARALRTARLKTASYTVAWPLRYGAALHPEVPSEPVTRAYTRYGLAVGEAFQLRDDLLGVYGDPATTGKPVGEDLTQAKPTVLMEVARTLATRAQRDELERLLRGPHPPDLTRLATLVRETGAADQVHLMIEQRVDAARRALLPAPLDPDAREALHDLAGAAARRTA